MHTDAQFQYVLALIRTHNIPASNVQHTPHTLTPVVQIASFSPATSSGSNPTSLGFALC